MKIIKKKGYSISELTLGTVQLGLSYGINNAGGMPSYEEASDILNTAIDGGIVSFDTAKAYGKSEEVLGRFFTENTYPKTLITKVVFEDTDASEVKNKLFNDVKDSLKKLGLSKLPLVMLHHEYDLDIYGKVLTDALKDLKGEGLVESVGISFSDKSKLIEYTDPTLFDCIQISANMFDNAEIRNGKIKELSQMGVSVFIRSVYLQGLFFMDTNKLPEVLQCAKPTLDKLHILAKENNMSMAEMALTYMRGVDGVTSLVLGCDNSKQLKESMSLFNLPLLSDCVQSKIMEISEEVPSIVIRPWEWNK